MVSLALLGPLPASPGGVMTLKQFSAPGSLTDFETAAQAAAWSNDLNKLFRNVMKEVAACVPASKLQFVNPLKVDTTGWSPAEISWPGFPNSLLAGDDQNPPLTQEEAYEIADRVGRP